MTAAAQLSAGLERIIPDLLTIAAADARRSINATTRQSVRRTWNHSGHQIPFPPHECLNGLEFTPQVSLDVLAKGLWDDAPQGQRVFNGDTWRPRSPGPADHPGCGCSWVVRTVEESLVVKSSQRIGDRVEMVVSIDGPDPKPGGCAPPAVNNWEDGDRNRAWAQIDIDLKSKAILREALSGLGITIGF